MTDTTRLSPEQIVDKNNPFAIRLFCIIQGSASPYEKKCFSIVRTASQRGTAFSQRKWSRATEALYLARKALTLAYLSETSLHKPKGAFGCSGTEQLLVTETKAVSQWAAILAKETLSLARGAPSPPPLHPYQVEYLHRLTNGRLHTYGGVTRIRRLHSGSA